MGSTTIYAAHWVGAVRVGMVVSAFFTSSTAAAVYALVTISVAVVAT